MELSWNEAVENLIELKNLGQFTQLSLVWRLFQCTVTLRTLNAILAKDLLTEICDQPGPTLCCVCSAVEQVLAHPPVLLVENSGHLVIINAHELSF